MPLTRQGCDKQQTVTTAVVLSPTSTSSGQRATDETGRRFDACEAGNGLLFPTTPHDDRTVWPCRTRSRPHAVPCSAALGWPAGRESGERGSMVASAAAM